MSPTTRSRLDGRDVFVKSRGAMSHGGPEASARAMAFFASEAEGLRRMAAAGVRVPEVVSADDERLVLAWLEPGPPRWEEGGRMLAALHSVRADTFGLDHDNFMGGVPQDNRPAPTFVAFFRARRLAPLAHLLPARTRARLDAVRFEDVLTEPDQPRLVHGDLWTGNLVHAAAGPTFIDPAIHFSHPEVDLAMMRLFGGFAPAFEAAWREALGISRGPDPDLERRVAALQLYPLLIHVRLFGSGYLPDIEDRLDRLT